MELANYGMCVVGLGWNNDLFGALNTISPEDTNRMLLAFLAVFSKFMFFFDDDIKLRTVLFVETVFKSLQRRNQSMRPFYNFMDDCMNCFREGAKARMCPAVRLLTQEQINSIPIIYKNDSKITEIEKPTVSDLEDMVNELHRLGTVLESKSPKYFWDQPRCIAIAMAHHQRLGKSSFLCSLDLPTLSEIAKMSLIED